MHSQEATLENNSPWYESPNGTCTILQPTLVNMGEGKPLHLMFPVHWAKSLEVLPQAKQMANNLKAMLVLLLHGEASDSQIASLIVELAEAEVLPLWIGEQNRQKVDRIISMLFSQIQENA
ncbi:MULTISPECIES: hypothetical protein [unclassified Coleofasciculus]|uniref:hypothetical protein n=1 Tax=unclassified Coleofasciculus TaxID=2692782 RepID=UPI00187E3C37|nr:MULTISPECIES: hypothetical protein [unclassified Coleofasciculus]MBE9126833.1 hypothetical protein [Coleofasciculus sp. LEGE 07081]MBE9148957.1 hypothetical protein [Coleofasciculus sp. LEGE 07092]